MWQKWVLWWDLIDVWQSEWSVVSWIWITKPSRTFWPRNWACGKFVQSWFQKTSPANKWKLKECVPGPSWAHRKWQTFFKHVIKSDESWIFEYDSETKRQSSEWHTSNSPRPKKARMSKSKIRSMLICFFDSEGVVHKEFVPQWQTVNKQYYGEVLGQFRKRVHRVRAEIADTWMLHHDKAPCHTTISVNEILTKRGVPVVPQPPYSPDLSSCYFFFFPKLKFNLKDRHFGTMDNIQKVVTDQLRALAQEDFQHCYREWEQRLRRCVASQRNYFDGDNVDF